MSWTPYGPPGRNRNGRSRLGGHAHAQAWRNLSRSGPGASPHAGRTFPRHRSSAPKMASRPSAWAPTRPGTLLRAELVGGFDEVLGWHAAVLAGLRLRVLGVPEGQRCSSKPGVIVHYDDFQSHELPATARSSGLRMGGFYSKRVSLGDLYGARLRPAHLCREGAQGCSSAARPERQRAPSRRFSAAPAERAEVDPLQDQSEDAGLPPPDGTLRGPRCAESRVHPCRAVMHSYLM